MKSIARHVAGFDLESMIARCRSLASQPVELLSSDWTEISGRRFDILFASLVLQHVETDICRKYLADFAPMAPLIYIITRLQNDFGVNVLELIDSSGLFDVRECVEVEHDFEQHQLRQVGPRSFAEVARATDNLHYEVVLTPRRCA